MQVDGDFPNHQQDCNQQKGKIELQSITLATLHEQCLHRKVETDTHRRSVVNACPSQSRFAVRNNCPTTL
jgi:hypothetical protein